MCWPPPNFFTGVTLDPAGDLALHMINRHVLKRSCVHAKGKVVTDGERWMSASLIDWYVFTPLVRKTRRSPSQAHATSNPPGPLSDANAASASAHAKRSGSSQLSLQIHSSICGCSSHLIKARLKTQTSVITAALITATAGQTTNLA